MFQKLCVACQKPMACRLVNAETTDYYCLNGRCARFGLVTVVFLEIQFSTPPCHHNACEDTAHDHH